MTRRWRMAGHCREVLATLLEGIESRSRDRKRSRSDVEPSAASQGSPDSLAEERRATKRHNTYRSPNNAQSPAAHHITSFTARSPYPDPQTPRLNAVSSGRTPQRRRFELSRPYTRVQGTRTPDAAMFNPSATRDGSSQPHKYP